MRVFVFLFISLLLPPFVAQAQSTGEAMEPQSDAAAQPAQPAGEAMPETEAQRAESEVDAPAQSDAMDEQSGFSRGSVVRSVFTTGIEDREPLDKMNQLDTGHSEVYYFTELRDMSGQTATHRWEYNDKVMAEVEFQVRGPRWRVWSKKSLVPGWAGEWKVTVLNGAGEVISEDVFMYTEQTAAEEPEDQPSAAPATADAPAAQNEGIEPAQD